MGNRYYCIYCLELAKFDKPQGCNAFQMIWLWGLRVYALNAATGAKLWSYDTRDYVNSSPAVANGVVYVGSINDNVYALNAATGATTAEVKLVRPGGTLSSNMPYQVP
jgi:outer membrane protein assembly factor BamB